MDSEYRTPEDIFTCTLCGECCRGYGGTYVTPGDIQRISRFIGCDPERFVSRFCNMSGSRPVLGLGEDGRCIFFDRLCTIHPVKPRMCRAWPFIQAVADHPENWEAMAGSCPGMKTGVPAEDIRRIVLTEISARQTPSNGNITED